MAPYAKRDPAMKKTYEGAPAGTGAIYTWAGNNEVGEGRLTIVESRPNELITIKLEFVRPFAATNTAEFTFKPEGDQTAVTWSLTGKNNLISKAIGLFMDVDKMVGGDFEKGLADLKSVKETSMTFESQHVSVSINRSADQVYAFASNPENLPKWAAGLSGSIKNVNGDWIAASPIGSVKVKFADQNVFGVLDHDVTLPSGEKVYNPMRVFPNNDGCELIFTLYRRPGTSDEMFAEDAQAVTRDLKKLKALLEK